MSQKAEVILDKYTRIHWTLKYAAETNSKMQDTWDGLRAYTWQGCLSGSLLTPEQGRKQGKSRGQLEMPGSRTWFAPQTQLPVLRMTPATNA